jgi:hypothetical protein
MMSAFVSYDTQHCIVLYHTSPTPRAGGHALSHLSRHYVRVLLAIWYVNMMRHFHVYVPRLVCYLAGHLGAVCMT